MSYAREIRNFLINNGVLDPNQSVDDHESLLELGLIDSIIILQLTAFITETYKVTIGEADLIPSNFNSLSAMQEYIKGHLPGRPTGG